ncbi:MAG: T9SS type A sorting domain-containing protein [Bacteroidetes bacterium]|nr:T9SS type A sorting domain-containing protein [Bacteroidota bacterium]
MKVNATRALLLACALFTGNLLAQTYATLPLTDNFTAGSLGASWSTSSSDAAGVLAPLNLSGAWPQFGTTTDASSTSTGGNGLAIYNTSTLATENQLSAKLALNLATLQGVSVKFSVVDWGTGANWGAGSTQCMDSLKVYLSTNGGTSFGATYTLVNLNQLPYSDGIWNNVSVDISAIATANSLTMTSTSVVKFVFNLKGSGDIVNPKSGNQFIYIDNFKANYTSILPVKLLYFNGEKEKEGNLLTWSTVTEINNDHFEILRSYDGTYFESIYSVEGKGNYSGISNYSFYDDSYNKGVVYYRLKQIDIDGSTSYSNIISLEDKQEISIKRFSEQSLSISGENLSAVEVYDLNGKLIAIQSLNKGLAAQIVSFDYSVLSESIYLVRVVGGETAFTQKIMF